MLDIWSIFGVVCCIRKKTRIFRISSASTLYHSFNNLKYSNNNDDDVLHAGFLPSLSVAIIRNARAGATSEWKNVEWKDNLIVVIKPHLNWINYTLVYLFFHTLQRALSLSRLISLRLLKNAQSAQLSRHLPLIWWKYSMFLDVIWYANPPPHRALGLHSGMRCCLSS